MCEQMKVKQIASNMIEVVKVVESDDSYGKYYILVSYQTPVVVVAFTNCKGKSVQNVYINGKYYSKTTTSHINKYLKNEWQFSDKAIAEFPRVHKFGVLNGKGESIQIMDN